MESPAKKRKINKAAKSEAFFELIKESNGIKTYKCKECKKEVNGTKKSNLTSHLRSHPNIYSDLEHDNSIETERLKLLWDCVELVGVNGQAFRCLTDSAIHSMNESLLARLQSAGRDLNLRDGNSIEVKEKLMNVAQKIRKKIAAEVKNRLLSLLVDIVSKRGRSILGVSVQYMMNEKVRVRSIGMIELEERHTGEYLADLIIMRLIELEIGLKQVITITTDGGSNVLKMVRDLNQILHTRIEQTNQPPMPLDSNQNIHTEMASDDAEIESVLSAEIELTDDQAIALILENIGDEPDSDDDAPTETDLISNQSILNDMQNNMQNIPDLDVVCNVTGIYCVVHKLQLAITDAVKGTTSANRNLMRLSRLIAKKMRKTSTMHDLKLDGVVITKPRIDVVTR